MLAARSLFVAVPRLLTPDQRDSFYALGIVRDTIELLYERLYDAACRAFVPGQPVPACDRMMRLAMFADTWSIIDNIARLRRLLKEASPSIAEATKEFCEASDNVRLIRNRLQHLDDFVGTEKHVSEKFALFGSIAWYDSRLPAITTVMITCGLAKESGVTGGPAIGNPTPTRFPVDHIHLGAFDLHLDISGLVAATMHTFAQMESIVEKRLDDQISEKGINPKELEERELSDAQGWLRIGPVEDAKKAV